MNALSTGSLARPELGTLPAMADGSNASHKIRRLEVRGGFWDGLEMDFAAGLDVVKVDKGSPAAKAGLRVGDRVRVRAHERVREIFTKRRLGRLESIAASP